MLTGKITTPEKAFEISNTIIRSQDDNIPLFKTLTKLGINDYYECKILMYDLLGDGAFFSLKQLEEEKIENKKKKKIQVFLQIF